MCVHGMAARLPSEVSHVCPCAAERPHPVHGVPVASAAIISSITAAARQRGMQAGANADTAPNNAPHNGMWIMYESNQRQLINAPAPNQNSLYHAGNVTLRDDRCVPRELPLVTSADGIAMADPGPVASGEDGCPGEVWAGWLGLCCTVGNQVMQHHSLGPQQLRCANFVNMGLCFLQRTVRTPCALLICDGRACRVDMYWNMAWSACCSAWPAQWITVHACMHICAPWQVVHLGRLHLPGRLHLLGIIHLWRLSVNRSLLVRTHARAQAQLPSVWLDAMGDDFTTSVLKQAGPASRWQLASRAASRRQPDALAAENTCISCSDSTLLQQGCLLARNCRVLMTHQDLCSPLILLVPVFLCRGCPPSRPIAPSSPRYARARCRCDFLALPFRVIKVNAMQCRVNAEDKWSLPGSTCPQGRMRCGVHARCHACTTPLGLDI